MPAISEVNGPSGSYDQAPSLVLSDGTAGTVQPGGMVWQFPQRAVLGTKGGLEVLASTR